MSTTMQFQLETNATTATVYLSRDLPLNQIDDLCAACAALPPRVRALRVILHGAHQLDGAMLSGLRVLMREWRAARGGECRLSFTTENLVITYTERDAAAVPTPARAPWITASASDAQTAAYL